MRSSDRYSDDTNGGGSAGQDQDQDSGSFNFPWWVICTYAVILIIIIAYISLIVYLVILHKKRRSDDNDNHAGGYNDPRIVDRFKRLHGAWNTLSKDTGLIGLIAELMKKNNDAPNPNIGSREIYMAFNKVDAYFKKTPTSARFRMTLIFLDGIVFYDSHMGIEDVYFMNNGLPMPVNLRTLGSPLKDHNVLPEVMNAISVYTLSDRYHYMGVMVRDPFLHRLIDDGFGFVERVSSSANVPCAYLANTIEYEADIGTRFRNHFILRVSMPI